MAKDREEEMAEKKTCGCLKDKEQYHEIICGRISCNCLYCSIPMSKCEYWIARQSQFDQEKNKEDWKDYLLEKK